MVNGHGGLWWFGGHVHQGLGNRAIEGQIHKQLLDEICQSGEICAHM